jgi:hypothetical protein
MAGAKQLETVVFILVPAGAVRPAVVCSGHYIVLHCGACRGGLQARRERRPGLQVPEVLIEVPELRVEACRTVPWSRRPSWRISLLAGRHGASCVPPGAASRVAA